MPEKRAIPEADAVVRIEQRLLSEFDDYRTRRAMLEERFLRDIRQYKGEYDPTEIENIRSMREGACELFLGVTRTKVRTMDARVNELVQGPIPNWGVGPTPIPDLGPEAMEEVAALAQADPELERVSPEEQVRRVARSRAEAMQIQMADHRVESNADELDRQVRHHGHKMGVGILKGPLVRGTTQRRWSQQVQVLPDGSELRQWRMMEQRGISPYFEVCHPLDLYLEWSVRSPEASPMYFQRHLFQKRTVAQILHGAREAERRGQPTEFYTARLKDYLDRNADGASTWENWEGQLYQGGKDYKPVVGPTRKRWELLECWGALTCEELLSLGMERQMKAWGYRLDEAGAALIEAHAWLTRGSEQDGSLVGLTLNPNDDASRAYTFYIPIPEEDCVYGTSVPALIRDPQRAINASFRAMKDNEALAVGPQIEMQIGRLISPGDFKRLYPNQIHAVKTADNPAMANSPAIRFSDFPIHVQVYLQALNHEKMWLDEVGGIPSYQHGAGSPGVGRTASGLQMLMGAAGQLVKEQLLAADAYQRESLTKLFNWEMQYNPDEGIKGDFKVAVKTTVSMLHKAQLAQMWNENLQLAGSNPAVAQWFKMREMLIERSRSMDTDPDIYIKTKQDMQAELEEQALIQARAQAAVAAEQGAGQPEGAPGIPGAPTGMNAPAGPESPAATMQPPAAAAGGVVNDEESALSELEAAFPDLLGGTAQHVPMN
jgi:hypothetical protein